VFEGYTVENVAIETLPGVFLPVRFIVRQREGPFAAVLCPHGHFGDTDMNLYGRYRPDQQYRCATLARMGAVVSVMICLHGVSLFSSLIRKFTKRLAMTMQTLNSMRVIDFLTSLPYVDKTRIGVTAAQGADTIILLTALDDRVTVSVPVVMVSSSFLGGVDVKAECQYILVPIWYK